MKLTYLKATIPFQHSFLDMFNSVIIQRKVGEGEGSSICYAFRMRLDEYTSNADLY